MAFKLNLSFGPCWENIGSIRHFITEILSTGVLQQGDAIKIATTTSELLENVVKYAAFGGAEISLVKEPERGVVSLDIKNLATAENLATFESIFAMVSEGTAKEAYKKMMLRSATEDTSQLGLARIRHECGGDISYQVAECQPGLSFCDSMVPADQNAKILQVTVHIDVPLQEQTEARL